MAATVDQIETALLAPWVSVADGGLGEWTATPYENIAWDNVSLNPAALADPSAWMEVTANAGAQRTIDVAHQAFIGHPTLTVSAHTPIGSGKAAARALLDAAAAMYRGRLLSAGSSKLNAYAFSPPVELPRDGWFKLSMQISFRLS